MDTLAINEKLLASDFTPQQAKAITTAIAASVNGEEYLTKADMAGMATKSDMAKLEKGMVELRAELKEDMAGLDNRITELRAELKEDMAGLDNRMTGLRAELKEDMVGLSMAAKSDMAALDKRIDKLENMIIEFRSDVKTGMANLETRLTNRMLYAFAVIMATIAAFGFLGN